MPKRAWSIASAREEGVPGTVNDIGESRPSILVPSTPNANIPITHPVRVNHDRRRMLAAIMPPYTGT